MPKRRTILGLILALTFISLIVDLPLIPLKFRYGPLKVDTKIGGYDLDFTLLGFRIKKDLKIKKGLDLSGGVHVVLEADMGEIKKEDRDTALSAAKNVIERRVNFFGVSEPIIQTSKVKESYRVIVELPGVTEVSEALDLIGQTAKLDFCETLITEGTEEMEGTEEKVSFKKTDLTGKDLKKAQIVFDPNTGKPQVGIKFSEEGAGKFEELTERNVGKPLAIFLDNQIISAPVVQEVISGGEAVISGQFSLDQAKRLAIQLNAGALPVPVKVVEQRNIGATLGKESVEKSLLAGLIGLLLVVAFMGAYYGKLGLLANCALVIYGLLTLALYKLIPVVLTLPGLAGFILSIGMAVDSNILIFERMKEEIRQGKPLKIAMELGFGRAWDSIRDANVCTLITCFLLFNPFNWGVLNTSGMVRGFALTLGLGVIISLFTGIVVTRTLIRVLYRG